MRLPKIRRSRKRPAQYFEARRFRFPISVCLTRNPRSMPAIVRDTLFCLYPYIPRFAVPQAQKSLRYKRPRRSGALSLWWSEGDLNPRHADFQSAALPTELPDHMCLPFAENPFEQTQDSILWQMAKRVNSFFQSIEAITTPTRIAGANGNVWEPIPFPPS